jgi:hypothetical protein
MKSICFLVDIIGRELRFWRILYGMMLQQHSCVKHGMDLAIALIPSFAFDGPSDCHFIC